MRNLNKFDFLKLILIINKFKLTKIIKNNKYN